MPTITTKDGVEIFYKDWGKGQPIVFSHGWPLSADDWDTQMLFFLNNGFRVIAHDRRGHGRSSQVSDGHDMDHYADDLAAVTAHLDLKNAVHVGHSTGGGEVVHYIARHGESRVAKAAILSAVPPLMVQTAANPGGLPKEVFDGLSGAARGQPHAVLSRSRRPGPFYGYNRPGAKPSEAVIENWWRQGMMGGAKAHYDGIVAFSQTDFTEDLKKITVPVLVMHGDDDQIVPYADSGAVVGEAFEERHAEDLQGLSARHADHGSRHHQRRPAGVHQIMKVILFGATGMVGQGVLRECLVDPGVEAVLSVGRSPTGGAASPSCVKSSTTISRTIPQIESAACRIRRLLLLPWRFLDRHGRGALPASDLRPHHGGGDGRWRDSIPAWCSPMSPAVAPTRPNRAR